MSRQIPELRAAKAIVEAYWKAKIRETSASESLSMLYEVVDSRPEDLLEHYEAIMKILKKAIKTIKENNKQ